MLELRAEFERMPAVGPGHSILGLPDLVVEALAGLSLPQVLQRTGLIVEGQQPIETRRVTVSDANGIAELSDTGIPAVAVVQSDMVPTKAGVIDDSGANAAR